MSMNVPLLFESLYPQEQNKDNLANHLLPQGALHSTCCQPDHRVVTPMGPLLAFPFPAKWSQGLTRGSVYVASPGPRRKGGDDRGEVSVPHWLGQRQSPLHSCACTPAACPQPSPPASLAPEAMRRLLPLLLLLGAWATPGATGDRISLSASAPQLDDEEKYSAHMPTHLRCDACRAVAYQVSPPQPQADSAPAHTPPSILHATSAP